MSCADAVLTGKNYILLSMAFTQVFSTDVFGTSHILFKYFVNIFVSGLEQRVRIYIIPYLKFAGKSPLPQALYVGREALNL